ncbi:retinoblastoma family protein [Phlebotomus argentipes]|uniref:retinoblastoma family protein n=1 Tax=Phlebotomus argentipes TaxID=94469 RepID=UPI00289322DE|nr:retinoblastoma family protein [Phlebotomus argentipes]
MDSNTESTSVAEEFKNICLKLNMDAETEKKTWASFENIRDNYTLEGNPIHWLCCALVIACRDSFTRTVGSQNNLVLGNGVSLSSILRNCTIGFREFFEKIKTWCDMASVPVVVRKRIERLNDSFTVSSVVYKKFGPLFQQVFNCPPNEEARHGKSKKAKNIPCNAVKLFEFTWKLYTCVRAEEPKESVDLVTSHHLLLACVNLIYSNVIAENRRDLVNTSFSGVPENWNSSSFDAKAISPVCVMSKLCDSDSIVEALHIQKIKWNKIIKSFFEKGHLQGDSETFLNLISVANFDSNFRSIGNLYEQYVISCGEIDETIFLSCAQTGSLNYGGKIKDENTRENTLDPGTPVTRRSMLPPKENLSPITAAAMSVKKLRNCLGNIEAYPHASLRDSFKSCSVDPTQKIKDILERMERQFCEKVPRWPAERLTLTKALFYRLLENIVRDEEAKKKTSAKHVYSSETIIVRLMAISVEIVFRAYNCTHELFPWILDCFQLAAFDFYGIIELVVRAGEEFFTREIIKHLNYVEEQCLEELVWKNHSPLWGKLAHVDKSKLSWQDVDLPAFTAGDLTGITPHSAPLMRIDSLSTPGQSLAGPSSSRIIANIGSGPNTPIHSSETHNREAAIRKQLFRSDSGPNLDSVNGSATTAQQTPRLPRPPSEIMDDVTTTPQKKQSLVIFFRKFHKLAYQRMSFIYQELGLEDRANLRKIWTLFEYSVLNYTELMKERHMDQILMCAIYVFCRVQKLQKNFKDIMQAYRHQPQSASHIYRNVFIGYTGNQRSGNGVPAAHEAPTPQRPAQPNELAGTSTSHENEERGDIIKFYNFVYVLKMQQFAINFSSTATNQILLSPVPNAQSTMCSPRKVSACVFVQTREKKELLMSPGSLEYSVFDSPSKSNDLNAINELISRNCGTNGKRPFPINGAEGFQPPTKVPNIRKFKTLLDDRQELQNQDDRKAI